MSLPVGLGEVLDGQDFSGAVEVDRAGVDMKSGDRTGLITVILALCYKFGCLICTAYCVFKLRLMVGCVSGSVVFAVRCWWLRVIFSYLNHNVCCNLLYVSNNLVCCHLLPLKPSVFLFISTDNTVILNH